MAKSFPLPSSAANITWIVVAFCFQLNATIAADLLSIEEQGVVRDAVYNQKMMIYSIDVERPHDAPLTRLFIPQALKDSYQKHPAPVLELLLKITKGANPGESALAAGYAISLVEGPAVGVVCCDWFNKDAYDKTDENWGTTPREHWIVQVQQLATRAKPPK
jgi:hypothetical protein